MHQGHAESEITLWCLGNADHQCGIFIGVTRFVARRYETAESAAAIHVNAEWLNGPNYYIGSIFTGRFEYAKRQRIHTDA